MSHDSGTLYVLDSLLTKNKITQVPLNVLKNTLAMRVW